MSTSRQANRNQINMKKLALVFCSLILLLPAMGQNKYNNNWITGGPFAFLINFDSIPAKANWLVDSNGSAKYLFFGAHSCISDSLGLLKLVCTGAKVCIVLKLVDSFLRFAQRDKIAVFDVLVLLFHFCVISRSGLGDLVSGKI
jgi:hypothetical protein